MSLYAWGKNNHGQLGIRKVQEPRRSKLKPHERQQNQSARVGKASRFGQEKLSKSQKPVCVEADGECFVAAAAGENHTLVVTQYGDVKAFGRGREGQLGHGEDARQDSDVPRKVEGLSDVTAIAVACGAFHSLAVTSSGRLFEWGLVHTEPDMSTNEAVTDAELLALAGPSRNPNNPNSRLSSVVADSARRWLAATDAEYNEGDTSSSEDDRIDRERDLMQRIMMGRLPTRSRQLVPRLARSLLHSRVTSVSAGYAHSIAVTDEGRAFASGQNDRGQLGLAHRIHSGKFREVVGMSNCFIVEVACGEQHNLARVLPSRKASSKEEAELYVWGGGRLGQLGLGAPSTRLAPTHNPFLSGVGGGVVSVSAGANHSVCAVASGLVFGWGHAEYNQQGVAVVAGADLMGDREGHGYFRVPRVVRGLDGTHVMSVHCGSNFTLAVDRNGATFSFGWNEGDALGRGWQGDPSPGPVPSLPGVISIAAGSRHVAAVTSEGPALGRHLRSLVGDADSCDVELLVADAAFRGEPNTRVPCHMAVISARCRYLVGHVEAALKAEAEDKDIGGRNRGATRRRGDQPRTATLCLEHATAATVRLLVRYLYTDEVPPDVSGQTLDTLGGLAREVLLPRLEALCVERLPYSLRRRYIRRNTGTALATAGAVKIPRSTFVADLRALAGRVERSDVTLVLPAWQWQFYCHKAILCLSTWWNALLKGGFLEDGRDTVDMSGLLKEGITRPQALEAAVTHIYTNSPETVVGMEPSIVMEVVILAEFMNLPTLTSACQRELGRYVDADSAIYLAHFANMYHLFKLESLCREKLGA